MLEISLNFSPDTGHKRSKFSKILPKKSFKFVSRKKDSIFIFKLSFLLLLVKVDPIQEK